MAEAAGNRKGVFCYFHAGQCWFGDRPDVTDIGIAVKGRWHIFHVGWKAGNHPCIGHIQGIF